MPKTGPASYPLGPCRSPVRLRGAALRGGRARGTVRLGWGAALDRSGDGAILAVPDLKEDRDRRGSRGVVGVIVEEALSQRPSSLPADLPIVAGVDRDLLRDGEVVEVDGDAGTVELTAVEEVRVVTSFLERPDGRVLLLRRSGSVGSFQGRWAGVSGFLEDPRPIDQAHREIEEETGVPRSALTLAAEGAPVYARDGHRIYTVHPFRFRVGLVDVRIDWEHTEFDWVDPEEIGRRTTVPKLDRVWAAVAPPAPPRAGGKKR